MTMCGISGLFLREGERVDETQLRSMAHEMRRRGPDAEGLFIEGPVGLAHRRLKIIDLSEAGNQPMFNEDGRVGIVFNGEIYNFKGLRVELESRGHRFKSKTDTEVIIHAFEEWGESAFEKLNGMFAFALWDGRGSHPVLYLVRDHFGIKPLFYANLKGRLAFASELKPLMQLPWVGKSINKETVLAFLKFSHVPTPSSIFEEVKQLQPGHFLRIDGGELTSRCYWDYKKMISSGRKIKTPRRDQTTEKDLLLRLDHVLQDCVDRQSVSDVPLGCFLSGGIDSSLLTAASVAGLARAGSGSKLMTFSIGYKEAEFDEAPFARQIADGFGTEHYEFIASPQDFFDVIPDVPTYFDQPFADPTLLSSLLLAREARKKVTVALSGDGGDELFFGYPHEKALLSLAHLQWIPHSAREVVFEAAGATLQAVMRGPWKRMGQQARKLSEMLQFESQAELFQYFIGTLGPMRMDRLARLIEGGETLKQDYFGPLMKQLAELPAWQRIAQVFIRTFLVDTVLAKTDRTGMAFGLEARVPFLDDRMIELSHEVPFDLQMKKGQSKYLLRKLLEKKLEEKGISTSLSRRGKQGFSIPLREWLRGDLKYLLDEYLNVPRLSREGLFNAKEVNSLVKQHVNDVSNHSHLLWSLVSFQMWKEQYLS